MKFLFVLTIIMFSIIGFAEAYNFEKSLEICERYYEEGDYKKAYDLSEKIIRKLSKQNKGLAIVKVNFYKAKYLAALGEYKKFEAIIAETLKKKAYKGEQTLLFAKASIDVAALYLEYSDVVTAETYLEQTKSILSKIDGALDKDGNPTDEYFNYQFYNIQTQLDLSRGNYQEIRSLLPAYLSLTEKRLEVKEIYYNEVSNRVDERKLDAYQQRRRKRQHAEALLLKAKTERLSGHYAIAGNFLEDAEIWIKLYLNSKDLSYIKVQHEKVKLMIDEKEEAKAIKKSLEKLLFLAERRLGPVHKTFIAIHETLLDYYIAHYHPKSRIQQWELRTNMVKYFGKDKTPHAVSVRIDAKKDFFNRNFKEARKSLEQLLANKEKVPLNHEERHKVLSLIYEVAIAQEDYTAGLSYLKMLMDTQERIYGQESLPWHYSRMKLAAFYMNYTSDFSVADTLMQKSFVAFIGKRIDEQHNDYADFLGQYAAYYEINGNYTGAQKFTDKIVSLANARFGNDHLQYAIALEKKIDLNLTTGKFDDIDEQIDSLLYIFKRDYDHTYVYEYAKALETSARFYATMGLYREANSLLDQSERLITKSVHASANSSATDELVYLYLSSENFKEADQLLNQILAVRQERYGEDSRFMITPLSQKAALLNINGDYTQAEELLRTAEDISMKVYGDSSWQHAEVMLVKNELQMTIGDYEQAKESLEKVIAIQGKVFGEGHIEQVNSIIKLALVELAMGQKSENIVELLEKALSIIAETLGKDNPVYASALMDLAEFHLATHQPEKALGYTKEAANVWYSKFGDKHNSNMADIESLMGKIKLAQDQNEQSLQHFKESARIYKKVFSKQHPSYVRTISQKAQVYNRLGKEKRSRKYADKVLANSLNYIEEFFPALSGREKGKYWATIRDDFEFFNNLAFANPSKKMLRQAYDNTLATKSLLLSNSVKMRNLIYESKDSVVIALFEQWADKKEYLTKVLAMGAEQQKEVGTSPKELLQELEELEKTLNAKSAIFEQTNLETPTTWKEVRDALQKGEAAIELIRLKVYDKGFSDSVAYAALILRPGFSAPELVMFPNGNAMETNYFQYFRYCIQFNVEDENSFKAFWKPIYDRLPEKTKIFLSPDGVYSQLNLEAIQMDSANYLIDHSNISLIGSTADLVKKPSLKPTSDGQLMVFFGNPVFYSDLPKEDISRYNDREISQLPGTENEAKKLRELAVGKGLENTRLYLNYDASEAVVKSLKSPKVLHFATHGFFFPDQETSTLDALQQSNAAYKNPLLRSGLLFREAGDLMAEGNVYAFNRKDGVLTAYEAMNLHLDGTDLVVLSACETGRGESKVGEGVYGLQRALSVAGADAIIMSLFKVSDEATQKLMELFYANWLDKGMGKNAAFVEAKRTLRLQYHDPIFWGAFIMVASGR